METVKELAEKDDYDYEFSTYSYYDLGEVVVPRNELGVLGTQAGYQIPFAAAHTLAMQPGLTYHSGTQASGRCVTRTSTS